MQLGRRLWWGGVLGAGAYWLLRYFRPQHSTLVLSEKVAIITGASSGIGRALAFAFARRGAKVVLVARSEERLEAVRREIEPYTSDVRVFPANLSDEADLRRVVESTLDAFGRVDVLVNNAGVSLGGPLQDQDPQEVERLLRVNLWAAIRLTQLVLPPMLARHEGYILNVGSTLGRVAGPLFSVYTASKYGLSGFTDALRRELHGSGVHLTLALPAWTYTEMLNPDVQEAVDRAGYHIDHPDAIAERAILALVHGENEVIMGGTLPWLGVLGERLTPFLVSLYWRLKLNSDWIQATRGIGSPPPRQPRQPD